MVWKSPNPHTAKEEETAVRVSTLLRKLLCVTSLIVTGARFEPAGLIIDVRPRWKRPRCSTCRKPATAYDRRPVRRWKHLALGTMVLWLQYAPRRAQCRRCGIKIEHVPWAAADRRFSSVLEEMVAYLATATSRTVVRDLVGINWRTVGSIVERIVAERLDTTRLGALRDIGVDEFSYRKRHRYLTIVVDHDRRRVIWAGVGKSGETLRRFFDLIGEQAAHAIENVTMDMAGGYVSVVRERAPQANIVFDRFHVAQLASNALDEVRRSIVRQLAGSDEARTVKNTRWALLKNPDDLSRNQHRKLCDLQRVHQPLYRAYLLKESLAGALDYRQPKRARRALDEWLAWASRSRLAPFLRLARTIRTHRDDILRYVSLRLTNALAEGINNRIRVISRIAYGFHRPQALISWIYLCCGGIRLNPALPNSYPLLLQ